MSHLSTAAEAMAAVTRTITDDQLTNRTPCPAYDVRGLVNHLLFWGPSLAGAGRKESVPQPAAAESEVELADGEWRARLLALLDDITSSWAPASAWAGETSMGTPQLLPAPVMGGMIVGELAVHGWDLAVATGQRLELPADLLEYLHGTVFATVEQGREMGMYGPEVAVPADAPTLARVLGLTGRDPAWA
ncbi:TIGR03086 family protein [Actinocatenispora thailandica]|uniref:TIGR03086 family protein n=1 Tax=Actinocatenispora thailandica TaxID=227318 RepID=A0A7R7DJ49_9ACTN|nr:TIGR03086 family metal-binding protein [Actinocatenispora thailandica]BCJ32608.1 TIGR03086 family protein [Actinocatenispora thailandica]